MHGQDWGPSWKNIIPKASWRGATCQLTSSAVSIFQSRFPKFNIRSPTFLLFQKLVSDHGHRPCLVTRPGWEVHGTVIAKPSSLPKIMKQVTCYFKMLEFHMIWLWLLHCVINIGTSGRTGPTDIMGSIGMWVIILNLNSNHELQTPRFFQVTLFCLKLIPSESINHHWQIKNHLAYEYSTKMIMLLSAKDSV